MFNKYKILGSKYALGKMLAVVTIALAVASCNKNVNTELQSPENTTESSKSGKKVLMVVVDGLVGSELKTIAPANITNYSQNAIYSYDGIASYTNDSVTNAYGWASLLTGVQVNKHNVTSVDGANNLVNYPTIFTKLKSVKPDVSSVAVSTNKFVNDVLVKDATDKSVFENNDQAAIDKAQSVLKNGNPDLLMIQLSGVDAAGQSSSYTAGDNVYATAVNKVDVAIGNFVKTIQSRSNFKKEEWLVVIASGKGSNARYVPTGTSTWNAFDDKMHNSFIMYYNPRFIPKQFAKPVGIIPYLGNTPVYTVSGGTAQTTTGGYIPNGTLNGKMDFGANSEFTIQCKVKIPAGSYNYPSFIGKRQNFTDGNRTAGFLFFLEGNYWGANYMPDVTSIGRRQALGTTVSDASWHTLTAVTRIENGQRKIVVFTDGVRGNSVNMNMTDSYISTTDFTVGWRDQSNGGTAINISVTDIRVYNTALSDTYIANNFCKVVVDDNDIYKNNLVIFLPNTDIKTDTNGSFYSPDISGNNFNMIQKSGPTVSFNDQTARVCPPFTDLTYSSLMNTVDVSYQLYSWLGISPSTSWKLDGKVVLPNYIDVSN